MVRLALWGWHGEAPGCATHAGGGLGPLGLESNSSQGAAVHPSCRAEVAILACFDTRTSPNRRSSSLPRTGGCRTLMTASAGPAVPRAHLCIATSAYCIWLWAYSGLPSTPVGARCTPVPLRKPVPPSIQTRLLLLSARRNYKTPAGHDYFFDPATERIHYLSATGYNNYVIDPMRNNAVGYNSLHELEAKLAAGYTGEVEVESDEEADGESAPLSPSKDTAHTEQKGFKKSVKAMAAKRVRIAAEGGRGDKGPPLSGLVAEQTL